MLIALDEWLAGRTGMVWWLHCIGGIGKTQVARTLAARAAAAGRLVAWVDGNAVEPSPRGVCEARFESLGIESAEPEPIVAAAAALPAGTLIVFDTIERCRQIDAWLRPSLVLALATRREVAGRQPRRSGAAMGVLGSAARPAGIDRTGGAVRARRTGDAGRARRSRSRAGGHGAVHAATRSRCGSRPG